MPQVIFAPSALRDMERLRDFLRPKNPAAAKHAASAIIKTIKTLEDYPEIGRPADEMDPTYRELLISYGDSGYIALYHYNGQSVTVVAIRHQKEAGF